MIQNILGVMLFISLIGLIYTVGEMITLHRNAKQEEKKSASLKKDSKL